MDFGWKTITVGSGCGKFVSIGVERNRKGIEKDTPILIIITTLTTEVPEGGKDSFLICYKFLIFSRLYTHA